MSLEKKKKLNRDKLVKNVKTGGDILMYVGSAALMMPQIQKSKENQNALLGAAATGTGIILAAGLGSLASSVLNKAVDKVINFWDDVKPKEDEKVDEASHE
jgi:hypothetical protein